MLGPASLIEHIISGVDYSNNGLIYSIHCTKTNECPVTITTIGGSTVEFPIASFIKGGVYHIYIKTMRFDMELAGFIGYKQIK